MVVAVLQYFAQCVLSCVAVVAVIVFSTPRECMLLRTVGG